MHFICKCFSHFLFLSVYWFVPIDLCNVLEAQHSLLAMQNEAKRSDYRSFVEASQTIITAIVLFKVGF